MFGWEPGIGDPTVYGWATVAAYALGAACCWAASRGAPLGEKRSWLILTLFMAFLCINKQLDLQTFLTDFGRAEAKAHGWYDQRREFQLGFIIAFGFATFLSQLILLRRSVRASLAIRGAMVGFGLLLLFVLVRASSFYKVDWLINQRIGNLAANHVMELGGIAAITFFALAAVWNSRRRGRA